MKSYFIFSFLFVLNLIFRTFCDDFSILSGVLDSQQGDVIAAFGDFNADKLIDIFVINRAGCVLYVHLCSARLFCSAVWLPICASISFTLSLADFKSHSAIFY